MSKKRFLIAIILVFVVMFSAKNVESSHSGDSQSEPSHEKGIRVKIDETGPELWDFHFTSSSSDCYIKLTDEDDDFLGIGGRDDNAESLGIKGEIIKHTGSNSLSSASGSCSGERDACEILKRKWSGGMKKKCGDCSLAEGNTIYRPKGDLLCGFDGYWYLCYSDFHGGSDKIFNRWGHAYKCTTSNEWQIATEICGNDIDDDLINGKDCADPTCFKSVSEFHPSCDPDSNKKVCEGTGLPDVAITKPKYGFEQDQSLLKNKCCGDDGDLDNGQVIGGFLCNVAPDGSGQWIKALDNTGKIILNKNNLEYVSNGEKWLKCDGGFESQANKIEINRHDYFCIGKNKESIVECCGGENCNSKTDGAGKRLTTGKFVKASAQSQSNPPSGNVVYDVNSITGRVVETFCPPPVLTASPSEGKIPLEVVLTADATNFIECVKETYLTPDWDYTLQWTFKFDDFDANGLGGNYDANYFATHLIANHKIQQSSHKYEKLGLHNPSVQVEIQPENVEFRSAVASAQVNVVATLQDLCRNGVVDVDKGEECDGSKFKNDVTTCASYNSNMYTSGNLACKNDCKISTENCVLKTCGDGNINRGEECDGTNLNRKTCKDLGFDDGTLKCNACKFDTSGCTKAQAAEKTFYCRSDGKFVTDLDAPSDKARENEATCNATGFKWTGTKCCSEDDDIIVARNIYEFYNDPSGIGGCWNSTAVLSVNLVDGTNFSVINYNGGFHGCAVKEINFNKDNDNLLRILDKHTVTNLITDHVYCFSDTSKSYYCSYAETWNLTYGKDKAVLKSAEAIVAMPKQIKECCAQDQCWNGTVCIDNQKNDNSLLSKLTGDSYRCVDGEWKKSEIKPNIDGTESGYCADETQCLVDSDASDLSKRCIASGSYTDTGDNYCDNGQWSSRTKLLALKLLNIKGNEDFTLFCDNKENALNNLMYNIDAKGISQILGSDLQTNNFCILEFSRNKKVIVAASMNADPKNKVSAMLKIFNLRINACNANAFNADGQYHFCDAEKKLWFNYKLKSFIYSTSGITVTSDESTILSDLINRLINLAKGISYPSVDDSFVRNIKKFDRLYMTEYKINPATSEKRTINAAIESKSAINIKSAVFEYKNFDTNICSFIVQYKNRLSSDRISCSGNNKDYSAVVQGSEFYPPDPDLIWPDLTSKLRLR